MTRRALIGAGAAFLASPSLVVAAPATNRPWLDYQARLTARIADAGGGVFDPDYDMALLDQVNRFRQTGGAEPLLWDEGLASCARAHIADLLDRSYFAHESPDGFTHIDRVSLMVRDFCGPTAENLAWRDYPGERSSPAHFQKMWEDSPSHRRNLINPTFKRAGYGVVRLGRAVFAAGIYAGEGIKLGQDLPLLVTREEDLTAAIADASPVIERISLTAPFQRPTWTATPEKALPPLGEGMWQLRPLRPLGGTRYDVLTGPVFHSA